MYIVGARKCIKCTIDILTCSNVIYLRGVVEVVS